VLKKAGIVVAAAAAGLLALSPLAFAGDKGDDYDHHGYDHHGSSSVEVEENSNEANEETNGLVNVSGNNVNVPIQACNNNIPIANLVPVSDVTGIISLLQLGGSNSVETDESCTQNASAGDVLVQSIDD